MQLPFFGSGSKSIVGLDIGSSMVKAVELAPRGDGFELLHLGVARLAPEAIVEGAFLNSGAIVDAIREALTNAGIKTRKAAAAVSGHSVIVKQIALPAMTPAELEESIRWEAEQYIPFDVNEVNLDFQILSQGEDGQMDVLLVAAKKDLIDDYVNVMSEAGLQPSIVDVSAFAIENAFEANYDARQDEVVALINIGAQVININVVANGAPVFTRDVSAGGQQYTAEIQRTLSVGFDEAERIKLGDPRGAETKEVVPQEVEQAMRTVTDSIVAEIARSLDFFAATAAETRIQRVLFTGGSSKVSGIEEAFAERTGLPVESLNPLAKMLPTTRFDSDFLEDIAPSLGVGVGLALRRMDDA